METVISSAQIQGKWHNKSVKKVTLSEKHETEKYVRFSIPRYNSKIKVILLIPKPEHQNDKDVVPHFKIWTKSNRERLPANCIPKFMRYLEVARVILNEKLVSHVGFLSWMNISEDDLKAIAREERTTERIKSQRESLVRAQEELRREQQMYKIVNASVVMPKPVEVVSEVFYDPGIDD